MFTIIESQLVEAYFLFVIECGRNCRIILLLENDVYNVTSKTSASFRLEGSYFNTDLRNS